MASFPITSGVFQLPNSQPRWLGTVTVTCTSAAGGSVTVTDPNGSMIYATSFDGKGSTSLSPLNFPQLAPGAYTVVVTGTIVGTLNVGSQ